MVTIQLSKPICNFAGIPIPVPGEDRDFSIKDLLLHYLGVFTSKDGKTVIRVYDLGIRIQNCKDKEMTIENADFLLLKEASQTPQHGAMVMAQLLKELEATEATKTEPKKGNSE